MDNYDKLLDFLQKNEGKFMKVGIHGGDFSVYMDFSNWIIDGKINGELLCDLEVNIVDNNNLLTFYNDDGIKKCRTDKESMNVFDDGDFEIITDYGIVGFKFY